jgi:Mycothiol maleylpyruvate isomerase N-terminal domain
VRPLPGFLVSSQAAVNVGYGGSWQTIKEGAVTERSREADAFLATVGQAAPDSVSACDGWTTHEIAAHVTGIAVEVIRHLEPYLHGDPVPRTRSFEEREAPLQASMPCTAGTSSVTMRSAASSLTTWTSSTIR